MASSDSMDEDVTKFYDRNPTSVRKANTSSSAEASSDSGDDAEEISQPPSNKQKKKMSRDRKKNSISTQSEPSTSNKRSRKGEGKEGAKPSSKKAKKPAKADDEENATVVPGGAEKSPRKRGLVWTAKDEVALLKRLVAYCEKGKLRSLPKNMVVFYDIVRKDLDGPYNNEQLYKKLQGLKTKFLGARDKIKNKGFVGFKNAHEENVYMLSKQIWGNSGEEEAGNEKIVKVGNARFEEKRVAGDGAEEREEVKKKKKGDVEMAGEEEEEEEEEEKEEKDGDEDGDDDDDEEVEEKGRDEGEQNGNVNVKEVEASNVSESVRNRVAGMDTEKGEGNVGEETDSSEENVGEEDDSSESENESSGKDNSAQRDSNAVGKGSKFNIRDNSAQRDPNSELKQSTGRENPTHVLNGAGDNSRQKVAEGMSDKRREAATGHHDAGKNLSQSVEEGKSDARRRPRGNSTPNNASGKSNRGKRIGSTEHNKAGENLMHNVANRMSKESRRIETPIARENSTLHVSVDRSNEGRRIEATDLPNNEENLVQRISKAVANGSPCIATDDQHLLSDQLGKENLRILNEFKSQMFNENQERLDKWKNEIVNMVMKELQGSSNTARHTNLDFSMIKGSSARELPALSDEENEMLDRKWRKQQLVELEAASKHLSLLQEEYQLRLAKLRLRHK